MAVKTSHNLIEKFLQKRIGDPFIRISKLCWKHIAMVAKVLEGESREIREQVMRELVGSAVSKRIVRSVSVAAIGLVVSSGSALANECIYARVHYQEHMSNGYSLEYGDLADTVALFEQCRDKGPPDRYLYAEALYSARRHREAREEIATLLQHPGLSEELRGQALLLRARIQKRSQLGDVPDDALNDARAARELLRPIRVGKYLEATVLEAKLEAAIPGKSHLAAAYKLIQEVINFERGSDPDTFQAQVDAFLALQDWQDELGVLLGEGKAVRVGMAVPECGRSSAPANRELACLHRAYRVARDSGDVALERKVKTKYTRRILDLALLGTDDDYRSSLEHWIGRVATLNQMLAKNRQNRKWETARRVEDDVVSGALLLAKVLLFPPERLAASVYETFGVKSRLEAARRAQVYLLEAPSTTASSEFARQVLVTMAFVQEAHQCTGADRHRALQQVTERLNELFVKLNELSAGASESRAVQIDPVYQTLLDVAQGLYYQAMEQSSPELCSECSAKAQTAFESALAAFSGDDAKFLRSKGWLVPMERWLKEQTGVQETSGKSD